MARYTGPGKLTYGLTRTCAQMLSRWQRTANLGGHRYKKEPQTAGRLSRVCERHLKQRVALYLPRVTERLRMLVRRRQTNGHWDLLSGRIVRRFCSHY
jgi:hypothetical protein